MKTLAEITEELSQLDLKKVADQEVMAVLHQIPRVAVNVFDIPPDQALLRARTHPGTFPLDWKNEAAISVNPDPSRTDYGRANLKGVPWFYGCIPQGDEYDEARAVAVHEVSRILYDPSFNEDEEYAVVGDWRTKRELHVAVIVQAERFHAKNSKLQRDHQRYLKALRDAGVDVEEMLKLTGFLAEEYAKEVGLGESWQYKISAAFSQLMLDAGLDGVMFPSARAQGDARPYNIALRPSVIQDESELVAAFAYRILRTGDRTLPLMPYLADRTVSGDFQWMDTQYPLNSDRFLAEVNSMQAQQQQ